MRASLLVLPAVAVLCLASFGCHLRAAAGALGLADSIRGSGKRQAETRSVSAFHGISFGGAGSLDVRVGSPQSVKIEIDDNILPNITTEVHDGTLSIGSRHGYSSNGDLKVTIQAPSFDSIDLSGSSVSRLKGIKADTFKVSVSGSGSIEGIGSARKVELDISGSGRVNFTDLKAREVESDISGSGAVRVNATDSLKARISGSGSVSYTGHPKSVGRDISGSGSVNPLN